RRVAAARNASLSIAVRSLPRDRWRQRGRGGRVSQPEAARLSQRGVQVHFNADRRATASLGPRADHSARREGDVDAVVPLDGTRGPATVGRLCDPSLAARTIGAVLRLRYLSA